MQCQWTLISSTKVAINDQEPSILSDMFARVSSSMLRRTATTKQTLLGGTATTTTTKMANVSRVVRFAHSATKLSCAPTALEPKLSSALIAPHWQLYQEQVVQLNEMQDEIGYSSSNLVAAVRHLQSVADTAFEAKLACECLAHQHYFAGFTDVESRQQLGTALRKQLELHFESERKFLDLLAYHIGARFGQGWVWVVSIDGQLEIRTVDAGETYLSDADGDKIVPVFALDAWEHAYYPEYLQDYRSYVNAWWSVQDLVQAEAVVVDALRRAGLEPTD
jgi:superoxide dismutase